MRQLLLAAVLVFGLAHAADPEFKPSVVTESYTYARQSSSFNIAGINAASTTTNVSRVTVALDGMLITGDWEPKTLQSTTAADFKRGTDVYAAVNRNRLLLKLPDGSVVTTKIARREKQPRDAARRRN